MGHKVALKSRQEAATEKKPGKRAICIYKKIGHIRKTASNGPTTFLITSILFTTDIAQHYSTTVARGLMKERAKPFFWTVKKKTAHIRQVPRGKKEKKPLTNTENWHEPA